MTVLIHDQNETNSKNVLKDNTRETTIISDNGKIHPCICCFGCWIKTPGKCVINDGFENMGVLLSKCNQLVIISRCIYGSYSPFVKNVLDRFVCPYQLPYFKNINGETRHPGRYKNDITLSVHFYGEITAAEKDTAAKLVNKLLFNRVNVNFYRSFEEIHLFKTPVGS